MTIIILLLLVLDTVTGALVLARRLRAGACLDGIPGTCVPTSERDTCDSAAAGANACVGLAILKVPRTGSTWLAKELRGFPGVSIEFEPFTDAASPPHRGSSCGGHFFTVAVARALVSRLRCVTRDFRSQPCYWAWQHCNASWLQSRPSTTRPSVAGFLLNPMYTPGTKWDIAISKTHSRLIWLRRTNLVKMALSDIRRLASAAGRRPVDPMESRPPSEDLMRIKPRTLLSKVNMTLGAAGGRTLCSQ